ncbi:MAG: glycosyltransferase family 4 protein [Anaerolineales bacterium]|nr:glycosyltransferase family 4 protein [Anaerolineales bacterium]
MRILFVADGRSPIALNWIRYWAERGDEVHLASTFACAPDLAVRSLDLVPVAFSGAGSRSAPGRSGVLHSPHTVLLRATIRQWLGMLTLPGAARHLRTIVARVRPDLIHAMRIPYEGILAARSGTPVPLVISSWGNDFTLHARLSPWIQPAIRQTLRRAAGLHSDCQRDLRLAHMWGLAVDRPSLVVPGNGGIHTEIFYPPAEPPGEPVVVNPRGFRGYVRNDTFFKSIPLVLARQPQVRFRCAGMAGQPEALDWLKRLDVEAAVELLPPRPHAGMADVFRSAQVAVSPSTHDGTPNTLLEAMACGCFPVAGDLESIREWIVPGENGLLIDPADPQALAQAILNALDDAGLRQEALKKNARLIARRAEYRRCMAQAETFYRQIVGN